MCIHGSICCFKMIYIYCINLSLLFSRWLYSDWHIIVIFLQCVVCKLCIICELPIFLEYQDCKNVQQTTEHTEHNTVSHNVMHSIWHYISNVTNWLAVIYHPFLLFYLIGLAKIKEYSKIYQYKLNQNRICCIMLITAENNLDMTQFKELYT